jgi:predicted nucleic-acid-binding protein
MNGSLDTSILVQLVTCQRPDLVEAIERFIDDGSIFTVADAALLELAFVLEKEMQSSRSVIITVFEMLGTRHNLLFNRGIFNVATALYGQHPKLSFYDCYLSAYAEVQSATPLWTLDKKLANQSPSAKLLIPD